MIKTWLAHPLTKGLDIDDPRTTHLRLQIIQEKKFLRKIYEEWYRAIVEVLPSGDGAVWNWVQAQGSVSEFVPNLITSRSFTVPMFER